MKNKKFWAWKNQTDGEAVERVLELYGTIAEESWFDDDVTPKMFRDELYAGTGDITIWINSPGGDCVAASQIYSMLMDYKGKVTVKIDGLAASAASVIAMAGTRVLMAPTALMMIHNVWQYVCGNSAELRKAADILDVINDSSMQAYLLRAGDKLDKKTLAKMMDDETWLSASDCIKYGLADRYADEDADMTNAASVLQRANLNVQQRINLQTSLAAKLRQLTEQPEPQKEPETPKNKMPALMEILCGGKVKE